MRLKSWEFRPAISLAQSFDFRHAGLHTGKPFPSHLPIPLSGMWSLPSLINNEIQFILQS